MIRLTVLLLATVGALEAATCAAQQQPDKSSVQQDEKRQEACIARRAREGLNTRFAAHRCVNPSH
jgi:hypothetical protein